MLYMLVIFTLFLIEEDIIGAHEGSEWSICMHATVHRGRGTTSATPKRWTTASMKKFVEVTPMTHRF